MITFAKGVTNAAVPMSGVMVRKGIYETHMTGPEHLVELFHGYTYSGHPLAVAAGLATLDIYRDEGLFERARKLEPLFADAMMSLKGEPNVADIRPIGLLCGIDLEPIARQARHARLRGDRAHVPRARSLRARDRRHADRGAAADRQRKRHRRRSATRSPTVLRAVA